MLCGRYEGLKTLNGGGVDGGVVQVIPVGRSRLSCRRTGSCALTDKNVSRQTAAVAVETQSPISGLFRDYGTFNRQFPGASQFITPALGNRPAFELPRAERLRRTNAASRFSLCIVRDSEL